MAKKIPETMIRMQLLVSADLKQDIEAFAVKHSLSANEAMRLLTRRGLEVSGQPRTASQLLTEMGFLIRDLEARAQSE